jgi:hypothetical protein
MRISPIILPTRVGIENATTNRRALTRLNNILKAIPRILDVAPAVIGRYPPVVIVRRPLCIVATAPSPCDGVTVGPPLVIMDHVGAHSPPQLVNAVPAVPVGITPRVPTFPALGGREGGEEEERGNRLHVE